MLFEEHDFRVVRLSNGKYITEYKPKKKRLFIKNQWKPLITAFGCIDAWEYTSPGRAIDAVCSEIGKILASKIFDTCIGVSSCCESGYYKDDDDIKCWECKEPCTVISKVKGV